MNEITVPDYVLLYAFRYALNRTTSASSDISREILINWDKLNESFQKQVVRDIKEQFRRSSSEQFGDCTNIQDSEWIRLAYPDWQRIIERAKHE